MDAALKTTDVADDDSDNLDTNTQNYLYSLVYHDTSKLTVSNQLPFFVDRTGNDDDNGSRGGAAFEVVDISGQCDSHITSTSTQSESVAPQQGAIEEQSRRKRKKRKQVDGEAVDDGIGVKIGDAKRRVIDQLKLLAATSGPSSTPASASTSTSTSTPSREACPEGGEMSFLHVINDRLKRRRSGETTYPCLPTSPLLSASIGLGVKSTAHHAPAFIRVHQNDLSEFLADMQPDKGLWRVDVDDLLVTSPGRRKSDGGGRYFSEALDPMQTECAICLKRGHMAETCKRGGPVCILCGMEGHPKTQCPSRLCPLCLTDGHRPDKCHRYGPLLRQPCIRCGCLGHWKDQCPEIWRQYHSTVAPGCPTKPTYLSNDSQDSESDADSESQVDATGGADWCRYVSRMCHSTYCCNCAQSGHSVHECEQPTSSLNRCLGSFPSQQVRLYDSVDQFAPRTASRMPYGRELSGGIGDGCSYDEADVAHRGTNIKGVKTEPTGIEVEQQSWRSFRPAPLVGESFIPLTGASKPPPPKPAPPAHSNAARQRRALTFAEELRQLRDLARRLLPDGTSRSQVKKLTNRLKFWRRNGYQPSTPEEEDQMAHRMEEWVLEVADTHNYLHKLNFKRRCRLLNSTGATLELIRSCRQYGEPAQTNKHHHQQREPAAETTPPTRKKQKKKKDKVDSTSAIEFSAPAEAAPSAISSGDDGGGNWAGRLRTRCGMLQSALSLTQAKPGIGPKKEKKKKLMPRPKQQRQIMEVEEPEQKTKTKKKLRWRVKKQQQRQQQMEAEHQLDQKTTKKTKKLLWRSKKEPQQQKVDVEEQQQMQKTRKKKRKMVIR